MTREATRIVLRQGAGPPKRKIKAIDFFCGAGGLTRGLLDSGITVLAGVDNDVRLKRTYERNNRPSKFITSDIANVDIDTLRSELNICDNDVVLYAACTPCQPFSSLNQRRLAGAVQERQDHDRELLLRFGDIVVRNPPDFILVENVPGLSNAYGREVYTEFVAGLEQAGFVYRDAQQLDASDYGVPQVRKRFVMIASRHVEVALPDRYRTRKRTVRDAIGRFPAPAIGITGNKSRSAPSALVAVTANGKRFPNHVARELSPRHKDIVSRVPADGGSRSDIEDTTVLLECHRRAPKLHKDVFGRMAWDAPAPTMTCRCTDVYCGRFIHPEQDRGLSLREAAALQSFPASYEFHGTFFHAARQIGNAVPVRFGAALGRQVVRIAQAGLVGGAG
jgi:DNA (cytosine-5)-methyltransferase 1